MSQWAYITDQDGDLVNLHKMESIRLYQFEGKHAVLAYAPNADEGYVLKSGTEEECRSFQSALAHALSVDL